MQFSDAEIARRMAAMSRFTSLLEYVKSAVLRLLVRRLVWACSWVTALPTLSVRCGTLWSTKCFRYSRYSTNTK